MTTLAKRGGRVGVAALDESQRKAVLAYCEIAEASGALLSVRDLAELLAIDVSQEELEESLSSDEFLSSRVVVESDHVVLRRQGSDKKSPQEAMAEEERRKERAVANVRAASEFARFIARDSLFVAVAGTNSYLSAAPGDDIDFFCVTRTNGMWAFMLKALLLARVASTAKRGAPPFCFSFVLDERTAREELQGPKTALYARDTLTAKVISGDAAYHAILENATWMRSYFPAVYERRLGEAGAGHAQTSSGKQGSKVANMFLYRTLGSYVALRAWVLNRKLSKEGKTGAIFRAGVEPGRLEYASRRYVELGKMYQSLEKR